MLKLKKIKSKMVLIIALFFFAVFLWIYFYLFRPSNDVSMNFKRLPSFEENEYMISPKDNSGK